MLLIVIDGGCGEGRNGGGRCAGTGGGSGDRLGRGGRGGRAWSGRVGVGLV